MTKPTTPQLSEAKVYDLESSLLTAVEQKAMVHAPAVAALIRDWKATQAENERLRQWKAEALPLLTRYDNLAETFGGKLGSSKVTNLERGVAALREQLAGAQQKNERLSEKYRSADVHVAALLNARCGSGPTHLGIEHSLSIVDDEFGSLQSQLAQVTSERDELKRGEFICQRCGIRHDGEFERGDF